jgi:hypothetical protein
MSGQVSKLRRLSHTHMAIMKFMIENPDMGTEAVAAEFKYTPAWVSQLIHSDLFQMELKYWQNLGLSEATLGVRDRLNDVAHQSLARLQERLATVGNAIPVDSLVDISEMALKSLGFGAPRSAPVPASGNAPVFNTQINNFGNEPVDRKLLEDARARMRGTQQFLEVTPDVQRDGNSDNDLGPETSAHEETPAQGSDRPGLGGIVTESVAPVSLEPARVSG